VSARRRPRRWKRWLLVAGAALLVLVVGGPFVYFHFIEGPAPPPLHLSTVKRSRAGMDVDGTWTVSANSTAGYRVQEILFGQSNTAVGRTSAVTGHLTIAGTEVRGATVTVDLTRVQSDASQRDAQFQGRIMDTADHPTATFALTSPITLPRIPLVGTPVTVQGSGSLSLRGTTRPVTVTLSAQRTATAIQVSGSIPIQFSDYGIPNPSFGPASTGDSGLIEFLLDYARA
jgi:polyisoprenoid-binding protein YceI